MAVRLYFDAAVMLTFLLLIGRYLDYRLRDRARGAARHLLAMQTVLVRRFTARRGLETVAAREIRPGDRILLASGERSPVNGMLDDRGTEVDMSLVTGESVRSNGGAGHAACQAGSVSSRAIPCGCGSRPRVENSLVADLARLLEAGQQGRNHYVRLADRAARALCAGGLSFAGGSVCGLAVPRGRLFGRDHQCDHRLDHNLSLRAGLGGSGGADRGHGRLFRRRHVRQIRRRAGAAGRDRQGHFRQDRHAHLGNAGACRTAGHSAGDSGAGRKTGARQPSSAGPRGERWPAKRRGRPVSSGVRKCPGSGLERGDGEARERLGNAAWCGVPVTRIGPFPLWYRRGKEPRWAFRFEDRIRPESRAAGGGLKARRLGVEMLTGDTADPAGDVAAQAGIHGLVCRRAPRTKGGTAAGAGERGVTAC